MTIVTGAIVAALFLSSSSVSAATLYVVERYRGEVWSVDAASGEGRVVASGLGEMIGVAVDRKGRLFVSQFRGFVPASGTVALVDPLSGGFTPIEGTAEVFALATDPGADILYVGGYNTGDLYRLEETSPGVWTVSVEESFGWPNRISHGLKEGHLLYVVCQDTGVWVKDLTTQMLTFGVEIPTIPTILSKESGGHLIVGSEYDVLYRIDPSTWEVVRTYEGFGTPCGVAVDPSDNSVLVADHERGQVSRLDLASGAITIVTKAPVEPWQIALVGGASEPLRFTEVMPSPGRLRLGWKGGVGILVQQTLSLTDPGWETVPGTESQSMIELPLDGGSRFFRLIGP
jgi:DNA-binding beta-propeller fold protein YncE